MIALLDNPLLLMTTVILVGQVLGRLEFRRIKLGSSATLFAGLGASYVLNRYAGLSPGVSNHVFTLSLIGFISAVGLAASADIRTVLSQYGVRFIILGLVITATGATSTFLFMRFLPELGPSIIGTYVGALTSSPGLATALEIAKTANADSSALVGLGYSIAYLPGVLSVVLFPQIIRKSMAQSVKKSVREAAPAVSTPKFNIMGYAFVIAVGMLLGALKIRFSSTMTFSLGMTGGVLISALALGGSKRIKTMEFSFDPQHLNVIQSLSLNMFLAIVGLDYGYEAVQAIQQSGLILLVIGITSAVVSITVGYLLGKHMFKIEPYYLVGAICGGMTSTPGLASAIDTFNSDEIVSGYGATYPFALLFMIIFTNLLFMRI